MNRTSALVALSLSACTPAPEPTSIVATRNGAALLGLSDMGAIQAGKSADFIVLEANPLDQIRNTRRIASVYLRGEAVDRPRAGSARALGDLPGKALGSTDPLEAT